MVLQVLFDVLMWGLVVAFGLFAALLVVGSLRNSLGIGVKK